MKFKLKDIVLDNHPAYVAIGYALDETLIEKISDIAETEEFDEKELDIQLLIDGKEYDIKRFFQSLSDNYFNHLGNKVKTLLFKDTEKTIYSIQSTLYEIESKLDSINNDLSYDMKVIDVDKLIGNK